MNASANNALPPRPVAVKAVAPYRLWLRFDDGVEGEVDVSDLAGKGVFQAWKDAAFFSGVRLVPHGALRWSDDIELCPDALYLRLTGRKAEDIMPGLRRNEVADA